MIRLVPDTASSNNDMTADHILPTIPQHEKDEVNVKTGIWQIVSLDDYGNPRPPFYVATAISMDDKVDMKKLRSAIFSNELHKRRPKIAMAPKDIAERLTGYKSGTMAPICHSVNLMLFIDEGVIQSSESVISNHRLNIGSGKVGRCLLSTRDFITISQANPEGMKICSLVQ
jgi:hypothetical protein